MAKVKISARIPAELDQQLDLLSAQDDVSRSAVLVRLARLGLAVSQAQPGTPVRPSANYETSARGVATQHVDRAESGR